MFKFNKYLMMLGLCATPFVMAGCPSDDDDGDTAGGTDTATATATDTTPTTESESDTTPTTESDTTPTTESDTTPTTDTDSDTDTPTTDTDSGTDSGTDTGTDEIGACVPGCDNSDECCTILGLDPETCADMFPGFTCNDEAYCESVGCVEDQECIDLYQGTLDTCTPEGGCVLSCEEDAECETAFPTLDYTCVDSVCTAPEIPPCESDDDCGDGLQCDVDTGFCVECFEDADCADNDYGTVCDTEIGWCGCNDAADCAFRGDLCI